ncbi:MAG: type II toxin-antitoxin system PemK/MazF family toxin [Eubacterium sp.]|nr:type II toxin-antitoxin system PemK/MazF family toxin [Eubacterium sp.]
MNFEQGDVLKVEGLKGEFLVVSKNFFNLSEQAILCPIIKDTFRDPLHIWIDETDSFVLCEQMRMFDLRYRGWKKTNSISYIRLIDIVDAIQSIFDY